MKNLISYKNCFIRSESFQLEPSGSWIPRYVLTQLNADNGMNPASSHHDRLDKVCGTEGEADAIAVQDAMQRVDND